MATAVEVRVVAIPHVVAVVPVELPQTERLGTNRERSGGGVGGVGLVMALMPPIFVA